MYPHEMNMAAGEQERSRRSTRKDTSDGYFRGADSAFLRILERYGIRRGSLGGNGPEQREEPLHTGGRTRALSEVSFRLRFSIGRIRSGAVFEHRGVHK